jgi:hypothetical protein
LEIWGVSQLQHPIGIDTDKRPLTMLPFTGVIFNLGEEMCDCIASIAPSRGLAVFLSNLIFSSFAFVNSFECE